MTSLSLKLVYKCLVLNEKLSVSSCEHMRFRPSIELFLLPSCHFKETSARFAQNQPQLQLLHLQSPIVVNAALDCEGVLQCIDQVFDI